MSVKWSLVALVAKNDLQRGLQSLSRYSAKYSEDKRQRISNGTHWYLESTSADQGLKRLPIIKELMKTPYPQEGLTNETILQCDLQKDSHSLTLWLTPWMQRIFEVSLTGKYLLVVLDVSLFEKHWAVPADHPDLAFIQEVVAIVKPVFGWLDADFTGQPDDSWIEEGEFSENYIPPWQKYSPVVLGGVLSRKVSEYISLSKNNFFYVNSLGNDLYWISPPGSFLDQEIDTESNVGQAHFSAMRKLGAILGNIPASILEKLTPR